MQPDVVYIFFMHMLYGAFGEGAGNSFAAVIGVDGNVGDEIEAFLALPKRDQAGIADDAPVFLPDVTGEGQAGTICHAVRPFEKGAVTCRAAHILHVPPAFVVHGVGETGLDQVCNGGQVAQYIERTQVGVMLTSRWDGDGRHCGYYIIPTVIKCVFGSAINFVRIASMFITLEGPEGSGKTSHIPHLVEFLREKGHVVFPTREPGGTSISEQIRDILHDMKNAEMHPRTETLLYQAARAQIVEQVIQPRLADGEIVISDRYYDSTIAYQGYGHQQNLEDVRALVKYATGGLTPDLTILLDLDIEVGLKRKTQNEVEWNRMDAYTVEFHKRVRAGYLEMVKAEPQRWVVVNSDQAWESVQAELRRVIVEKLDKQVGTG
jgi:dTMP kinase